MHLFDRACARYFPALVDVIDGGRLNVETDAALLHLERCTRCRADLEATMLTVHGLRMLARTVHDAEPAPDAWTRLRARIEVSRPSRFLLAARLSSAALSIGIVAALALPFAVGRGDASGLGGMVQSDAPGHGFDPTPVILAERAFERPSARPGAIVVVQAERTRRSDAAPPGRLDGWVPAPLTTEDGDASVAPPVRRSTTY